MCRAQSLRRPLLTGLSRGHSGGVALHYGISGVDDLQRRGFLSSLLQPSSARRLAPILDGEVEVPRHSLNDDPTLLGRQALICGHGSTLLVYDAAVADAGASTDTDQVLTSS